MNASGVSVRHINSETCMTACYSQIPSQHLKGDWQEEAGFETGHGVTVKILRGVFDPDCRDGRSEGSTEGALSGEKVDEAY